MAVKTWTNRVELECLRRIASKSMEGVVPVLAVDHQTPEVGTSRPFCINFLALGLGLCLLHLDAIGPRLGIDGFSGPKATKGPVQILKLASHGTLAAALSRGFGKAFSYLWLVGNGGMGYNYSYYYYHSSIPCEPKVGFA